MAESPVPELPGTAPAARDVCPRCRRPVEVVWLFCPSCDERLKDTRDGPVRSRTGEGVGLKSLVHTIGVNGLAVLGVLSFISLLSACLGGGDRAARCMVVMVVLFFVGVIIAGRQVRRTGRAEQTPWLAVQMILAVYGLFLVALIALGVLADFIPGFWFFRFGF